MSHPVAVIDLGSNSIKLLVARLSPSGTVEPMLTETIETRISEGISKELPILSSDAMQKATKTVSELTQMAKNFHPKEIAVVATSAVRDAQNGADLIDLIKDATGLNLQILSGTEEATYIGRGLACDPSLANTTDFFQMDLGGGSLELIHFRDSEIHQAISLRLGAVRISERFISDREQPITSSVETAIRAYVIAELTQSGFSFAPESVPLIATGGAFAVSRAVLAAKVGRDIEDYEASIRDNELEELKNELCRQTLNERLNVPHLPPSRADILPTALITILAALQYAKREAFTHSFFNLRFGIAESLLNSPQNA